VSLIATWVFLASSVSRVCACVCACVCVCVCARARARLGLYAVLLFLRFLCAVKCAVAGSLIATGV
jgi:hypothetical protein